MSRFKFLATTAIGLIAATPCLAQTADTTSAQNQRPTVQPGQEATTQDAVGPTQGGAGDIIVTAQRQSQRLQDVPIAVSAFTAENLERQQITNPTALQQSLPSITFTKTNFTSSSFTIRGIGDLCVGITCDQATAIHVNDMPLRDTRLFETEFFDLERIEVLRGPQGTLFGRNATSGVVNFITAKPDLSGTHAAGEFEYGNYDSKRVRGMFNLPITDTLGVRVAGTYLNRDGYTRNTFNGDRIDDRDLYAVRGTLSWQPSADTRLDLMAYYFHEDDNRSRIQKQLCRRDPTGILGCLPDRLAYETLNGNATLPSTLASREFFAINNPALAPFAITSVYGADVYAGVVNPADVRQVRIDNTPTYFAEEEQYMGKLFHDFGPVSLNVTGGYARSTVDSTSDYNLAVQNSLSTNTGLLTLDAAGRPGGPAAFLNGVRQVLIPNGAAGGVCQSAADPNNVGVFGGNSIGCFAQSLDFDRSRLTTRTISAEAHIDSRLDGPFNFLLGGIYFDSKTRDGDFYVNSFGLDYASGILGAGASAAIPGVNGNTFLATPFFKAATPLFRLKSYGIFGETYFEASDKLKVTLGLRYNHDDKFVRARNQTFDVLTPIGATGIEQGLNYATTDFDPGTAGVQQFARRSVAFTRLTGRAVVDYRITSDNLLYASYSRGYKSGGINPPIPAAFSVPDAFAPEKVDSFEIGSKNTFGGGTLRLNLTGFYYRYKGLQLARIVNRSTINDNINADIYGAELEAVISPVRAFVVNANFSYLKTKVVGDQLFANPRDPSGGRSDAVIIKDLQNSFNCAVVPTTAGNAAGANAFVGAVNAALGLRAPVPVPGTSTTGAFGLCSVLASTAATPPAALGAAFGVPTGALPFTVLGTGVPVNVRNNALPQAPTYKVAVGAQYTIDVGSSGWTIVPRADLNYTGEFYASIFNQPIDRVKGYEVVNAQLQVNAPDERFYVRAFVQNLTANDAITGQFVADQSSGLFTNVFTVEPRRYGLAAGFKF